MFKMH